MRHNIKKMISAMLYAAFLLPICSASEEKKDEYTACRDKADDNYYEMDKCIGVELKRQDNRLNLNYKNAMKSLDEAGQASREKKLKDAQKAWIIFRDKNCNMEASYAEGGRLENIIYGDCLIRLTRERADILVTILDP